jgi:hypothetical protein
MYGVAGEKRPIFVESEAFVYNIVDHSCLRSPHTFTMKGSTEEHCFKIRFSTTSYMTEIQSLF